MPDFDKNLQPIIKEDRVSITPRVNPSAPEYTPPALGADNFPTLRQERETNVYDELNNLTKTADFREKGILVSDATLNANKRFSSFNPTVDNYEDFAAHGQSGLVKATNGVLKGVNLTATTVAGGFGMLGGLAISPFTGKFSDVWDNDFMQAIDKWNNKVDQEYLPNYYSARETAAKWYDTDNWFTANFLFDKLIKNSGFAVGAMISGNIANAGLMAAGKGIGMLAGSLAATDEAAQAFTLFTPILRNTARAFSASKNIEAATALEKGITSIADITAKAGELEKITKAAQGFAKFNDAARRTAVAIYSSAGEAAFEALQTSNEYRNNLIQKYKDEHDGQEPVGEALESINDATADVGKVSFFGNMALLSLTEYVQLPYIIGSSYKSSRQVANSILGKVDDVVLKEGKWAAKPHIPGKFGKLYEKAGVVRYVFDPKEAGQEIGQYALQVGTQNYFNKAREGKDATVWTDGFIYGLFGKNERGEDVGALNSKAGIEGGILGGITGGLMQARDKYRQKNFQQKNTEQFISSLNEAPTFQEAFKDKLAAANRGVVLQQQEQDAILNDDKLEAMDLKTDQMFNYMSPRIKYGRHDMIMSDLKEMKEVGSTEEGLAELKRQGMANINDTTESYRQKIDKLQSFASTLRDVYTSTNFRYSGEILKDKDGKPILTSDGKEMRKYPSLVIDKLVYTTAKIADYDRRIPELSTKLLTHGIDVSQILSGIIEENKPNKEATAEAIDKINKLNVVSDVKNDLKKELTDVIELSLRRKLFMDEYEAIKENPLNFAAPIDAETWGDEFGLNEPAEVVQKDGKKKVKKELEIGKEYSLENILHKEGNGLYLSPKITVLSRTLGGEYQVKLPNGKVTFLSAAEFGKYKIIDENNTNEEFDKIMDESIDAVIKSPKYKDIAAAPVTNKLAYVNSLDNKTLVSDIEKEFNSRTEALLKKLQEEEQTRKDIIKEEENINTQQDELEKDSGDEVSPDPVNTKDHKREGRRKHWKILFTSTTTESETWGDVSKSSAHVNRARAFFNNAHRFKNRNKLVSILVTAKNAASLGLDGIVQLSYKVDPSTKLEDVGKNTGLPDVSDENGGFIAAVFVEKDKGDLYFVDKDGKRINDKDGKPIKVGSSVDIHQVIFQTMPSTRVKNSKGVERYRMNEEKEALAAKDAWLEKRKQILAQEGFPLITYSFNISRGIPNIRTKTSEVDGVKVEIREKHHVGNVLIGGEDPEKIIRNQTDLLRVSTTGTVFDDVEEGEGRNVAFPKGLTIFKYKDTLEILDNTKLGRKKAKAVYSVIKALANELVTTKRINTAYATYIQNVLYWRKSGDVQKNQIYVDAKNAQIVIGAKVVSGKLVPNVYSLTEIADKESEIITYLQDVYHNINNKTLQTKGSKKFIEYDENGKELPAWKNYQTYLLSSKESDGKTSRSAEETPLTTPVAPATEAIPFSFMQKYAILNELELPAIQAPKADVAKVVGAQPIATPAASKVFEIGGIRVNDGEQTLKFNKGDVKFIPTIDDDGKIKVDVVVDSTIKDYASDSKTMVENILPPLIAAYGASPDIVTYLKNISDNIDAISQEEKEKVVKSFFENTIRGKLMQALASKPAEPVVAAQPAPKVEAAPVVSDIEDRRADIEKRRQEELNWEQRLNNANSKEELLKIIEDISGRTASDMSMGFNAAIPVASQFSDAKRIAIQDLKDIEKFFLKGINAKYDAELAELGGEKAETSDLDIAEQLIALGYTKDDIGAMAPEQVNDIIVNKKAKPVKETFKGKKGAKDIGPDTRKVAKGEKKAKRITDAEITFFKQWAEEVVPGIPYEVLENIVSINDTERAWGVFEEGVAKFYKHAIKGTEYHEIFEGIWKAFLTEEERQALLNEFKSRKGTFKDRETGKQISFADASDRQAKERIADDFADYRVGKLPARTLGQKIVKFFKDIINFFKQFVQKPTLKTDLFKAIDAGKFKEYKVAEKFKSAAPEYSRIPMMSESKALEFVEDMAFRVYQIIIGENKAMLFDINKTTGSDLFAKIKAHYIEEGIYDVTAGDKLDETQWKALVKRTRESLRTIGLKFDAEDLININEEDRNNRDYAPEPFSTDWKRYAPYALKLALSTLPQTVPTNQQEKDSLSLPERVETDIPGFKTIPFTKIFSTLINKLANTTNLNHMEQKLFDLAKSDSNFVRLFARIGGNLSNGTFNFSQFENTDWRLFIQFYQTFSKQHPKAFVQYVSGNDVYVDESESFGPIDDLYRRWLQNLKTLANDPHSAIVYDKSKKIYNFYKREGIYPATSPKTAEDAIKFLSSVGITFPSEVFAKLKTERQPGQRKSEQKQFFESVDAIYVYLQTAKELIAITDKSLKLTSRFKNLARLIVNVTNPVQENTRFNIEGNRTQNFTENNYSSVFENEFNSANTIDELKAVRPELNDIFSQNSIILKPNGEFFNEDREKRDDKDTFLKVAVIEGIADDSKKRGKTVAKVSEADRFILEINQNINGNYYILLPADGSTEWMINFGNHIDFEDVVAGERAWNNIFNIFNGYLDDDINLALDWRNRSYLKAIGEERAKDLRLFKEILPKEMVAEINKMVKRDASFSEIKEYITTNQDAVNDAIKEYITNTVDGTQEILVANKKIKVTTDSKTGELRYNFPGLDSRFSELHSLDKNNLTDTEVKDILTFVNINYVINHIEMHKVLFGDPYQFAEKNGKLDEVKRIKSFLSPRRTSFNSSEYNNFLNTEYNKVGDIDLDEDELGHHEHKDFLRTATLTDLDVATAMFPSINEANGFSFLQDNAYREVKLKNGQWSEEAEKWHQWQMAYTRQHLPGYKYINEELRASDRELMKTPEPPYTIEVLKPIVTGVKYGSNKFDLVLDKYAQMPLYYKMAQGKNLGKLYEKMWKEKMDYLVMESGRKVGVESTHDLYKENGVFNISPFNNIVEVSWKSYGIQVETSFDHPKMQTRGSQITKLASLDMFSNGEAVGETPERKEVVKKAYQRNTKALRMFHEFAYQRLLTKLGIKDLGGSYVLDDPKAVQEALEKEMLRRNLSENVKDIIQLDKNGQFIVPFEASVAYQKIRDILYSIINKSLISPKMHGSSKVQVPATLWEKSGEGRGLIIKDGDRWKKITTEEFVRLSDEEKKNVRLTSTALKFYTREDPYCEVLLPSWFKDKFVNSRFKTDEEILNYLNSTKEGREILSGIGFRIPTQAMASIEVFRVAGFLPAFMGDTIVVPSEIEAKTDSDFDIDKLNTYLKATYIDDNGNIRLIRFIGEDATKQFFSDLYTKRISNRIDKIRQDQFSKTLLYNVLNKMEIIPDAGTPNSERDNYVPTEEERKFMDDNADFIDTIIDMADSKDMLPSEYALQLLEQATDNASAREFGLAIKLMNEKLREDFISEKYQRALENEYYSSLEALLTLPENFDRLLHRVSNAGLNKVAQDLDELRGESELDKNGNPIIKNRLLDRNFMTKLRHAFVSAKKWVGIAATNITSHSLFQKTQVYLDPNRLNLVSDADARILGDGTVVLPHNAVEINGKMYVSLSGMTTADGVLDANGKPVYISDRLSGYATSFVDVSKDPYIMKIIMSDNVVSTFMFLERIGAGTYIPYFMNQPIIREYLRLLANKGTTYLYSKSNINAIKGMFGGGEIEIPLTEQLVKFDTLRKNIKDYRSQEGLTDDQNLVQQAILDEFLKYAKMAEYSFKLTQAINYDTTKFRSGASFSRKQTKTTTARESNIFSSVDDILDESFIGDQAYLIDGAMSAMGSIFKLQEDRFQEILKPIITPYEQDEYMGGEEFDRVANKLTLSFVDYIIQVKSGINKRIEELLIDPKTAVATKLIKAKEEYPHLAILQRLFADSSRFGHQDSNTKIVRLDVNIRDPFEENITTGMMEELKEVDEELYNAIIDLSIIQGSYQSSVSMRNVIPQEDFSRRVKNIFQTLTDDQEVKNFAKGWFQRNNWRDEAVVPTVQPKFFAPYIEDEFGNYMRDEEPLDFDPYDNPIYQYDIPAFQSPYLEPLGLKEYDRKILLLNEAYHSEDVRYDLVKVPRLLKNEFGEAIDILTGQTVTRAMLRAKLEKGDMSYYTSFGYQKVKYDNGKPVVTIKGEYVYKLVNLYGDGHFATEYYDDFIASKLNNGTVKVVNRENPQLSGEMPDASIIQHFGRKVQEDTVQASDIEYRGDLQMTPQHIAQIKSGEKTITTRLKQFRNGTYTLPDMTAININLAGVYKVMGSGVSVRAVNKDTGDAINGNEFARMEGYKDWNDFVQRAEFVKNFVNGRQSRYVYKIELTQFPEFEGNLPGKKETPEFNKLPFKSSTPTMTYAGIGSRETPFEIQGEMIKLAEELAKKGYTLRSGAAEGADKAFEEGAKEKKEIFPGNKSAGKIEHSIAAEIHPNWEGMLESARNKAEKKGKDPEAAAAYVANLMARNTNQIFGAKLDTPVDFVVAWTPDGATNYMQRSIKTGGTGQAIDMASRKGIPVINLANPNWREELDIALGIKVTDVEEVKEEQVIEPIEDLTFFQEPLPSLEEAEMAPELMETTEDEANVASILDARSQPINYTNGQKDALLNVQKLVDTRSRAVFLIAGYAGTGKTTITENIAKYSAFKGKQVRIAAPTNRAAKVINNKLKATGATASATTIHKLLYAGYDEINDTWVKGKKTKSSVIVIDEASMISKQLMKDLIDNLGNDNIIILMGDGFQLEQIGEDSKLFKSIQNPKLFQETYGVALDGSVELTEVKRQSMDSNILKLATIMRTDRKAYVPTVSIPNVEVVSDSSKFVKEFKDAVINNEDTIMIVTKNDERVTMNKVARMAKFGDKRKPIEIGDSMISIANSSDIPNSETFKIAEITDDEPIKTQVHLKFGENLLTYDMYISEIIDEEGIPHKLFMLPEYDKPSLYHQQLFNNLQAYNKELFDTLDNGIDIMAIGRRAALNPSIVISTYGYATTAHKAQGGQWEKVFVRQLFTASDWDGARWFYTAITRSSKDLIIAPTEKNVKISPADMNGKLDTLVIEDVAQNAPTPAMSETPTSGDKIISVDHYTITVKPDGRMFFKDGGEVMDQTIKNKASVRKELQEGTLRVSTYNKSKYFVLLDNRIVGSGTTNLGKESVKDPKIIESILATAVTYKKTC